MEKIYLLSFPRSGNTFTRYILEVLTGFPSRGYDHSFDRVSISNVGESSHGIIIKRHGHTAAEEQELANLSPDTKLILLIRNPIENFLRHKPDSFDAFLRKNETAFGSFFRNLRRYRAFSGPKMVVFYEDLATKPAIFVESLHSFVDSPLVGPKEFMAEYDRHFHASRSVYGESQSDGKSAVVHSRDLSGQSRVLFWKRFFENCPPGDHASFWKYLKV